MRLRRRAVPPPPLPPEPACAQVGAVLQSYLDGELGPADAEVVADHLAHCERCDIEAATISQVITAIRRQRPDLEHQAIDRLSAFVDELTDGGSHPAT